MIRISPYQRGTWNLWRLAQLPLHTTRKKGQLDLFQEKSSLPEAWAATHDEPMPNDPEYRVNQRPKNGPPVDTAD